MEVLGMILYAFVGGLAVAACVVAERERQKRLRMTSELIDLTMLAQRFMDGDEEVRLAVGRARLALGLSPSAVDVDIEDWEEPELGPISAHCAHPDESCQGTDAGGNCRLMRDVPWDERTCFYNSDYASMMRDDEDDYAAWKAARVDMTPEDRAREDRAIAIHQSEQREDDA